MSKATKKNTSDFALRITDVIHSEPLPCIRIWMTKGHNADWGEILCVVFEAKPNQPIYPNDRAEKVMYFRANDVEGAAAYIVGNAHMVRNWGKAELYRESNGNVLADWRLNPTENLDVQISCVKSLLRSLTATRCTMPYY